MVTEKDIQEFVVKVREKILTEFAKSNNDWDAEVTYSVGKRWVKVFNNNYIKPHKSKYGTSIYCFIDINNGDIYKADSTTKPAKHVRGNIYGGKNGLACLTPYGIEYLRH